MTAQKPIRIKRLLGTSDAFILEAEIDVLVARLAKVYPSLPDDARAEVILIGHSLSKLRQKMKWLQSNAAATRENIIPEHVRRVAA